MHRGTAPPMALGLAVLSRFAPHGAQTDPSGKLRGMVLPPGTGDSHRAVEEGALTTAKAEGPLLDEHAEAPLAEIEELGTLLTEGRERGFLTFEEVASCLEEVEVTKEKVR